jgi:hypothetical protein
MLFRPTYSCVLDQALARTLAPCLHRVHRVSFPIGPFGHIDAPLGAGIATTRGCKERRLLSRSPQSPGNALLAQVLGAPFSFWQRYAMIPPAPCRTMLPHHAPRGPVGISSPSTRDNISGIAVPATGSSPAVRRAGRQRFEERISYDEVHFLHRWGRLIPGQGGDRRLAGAPARCTMPT